MTTPTLIEAARAALDALGSLIDAQNGPPLIGQADEWDCAMYEANAAIDALRAAIEAAEGAQPEPAEDAAMRYDAVEAVRKATAALPRYSFLLNSGGGVSRVEDRSGRWIEWDEAHKLFDPEMVDWLLAKAQAAAAVNALPGLLDEVERLRADAARYRRLIERHVVEVSGRGDLGIRFDCDFDHWNDVSAALDAEIARDAEQGSAAC